MTNIVEIIDEYAELQKKAKAIEKQMSDLKASIVDEYNARKLDKNIAEPGLLQGTHIVAQVSEMVTKRFDSKEFKKDHEKLYKQYEYETRSTSVRLKNA